MSQNSNKVQVLIVDDSAIVRKILSEELAKDPQIEVLGTAPDPYIARDKILKLEPDVVILDMEMPRMDGLTFLKKIMKYHPLPVIIVSSLTGKGSEKALQALSHGAVGVLGKPGGPYSVGDMKVQLIEMVKASNRVRLKKYVSETSPRRKPVLVKPNLTRIKTTKKRIIAMGASTGGTEALKDVLSRLPNNMPGIVIVQHMPPYFTKPFADRLNNESAIYIKEAENRDCVKEGTAFIAPGGYHMILKRNQFGYYVETRDGPLVHHQKPAVDVLFKSVANIAGTEAIGVILTGMGRDGSAGMLVMRDTGAYNIAQDEESSVIFGMPKEAINNDSVHEVVPLPQIAERLVKIVERSQ